MVPRVGKPGRSFKGAGLYFLHDKEAETAERVAFTQTHNLPTDDPHAAMDWMAWTALHQGEIKDGAGVQRTGGDCARPVFHYSLAWHPDETPDESHMLGCARDTLELLGLIRHEAVVVAHRDQEHPHVHVIANLVHPETGRTHDPGLYKAKLSEWAEAYEQEHGLHCAQRAANREARQERQAEREAEPALSKKEVLQQLYAMSDDFETFQGALEHAGYRLAQGDRRGLVLVDPNGEVSSLSRQLDKEQRAQLRDQLKDMDVSSLPGVDETRANMQQAGDDQAEGEDRPLRQDQTGEDDHALRLAALQDRQLAELGDFYTRLHDERTQMQNALAQRYGAPLAQQRERAAELERALDHATGPRGLMRGLTGQAQRDAAELETVRERIQAMEAAIEASRGAFEERRQGEIAAFETRHAEERESIVPQTHDELQSIEPAQQPHERDGPAPSV